MSEFFKSQSRTLFGVFGVFGVICMGGYLYINQSFASEGLVIEFARKNYEGREWQTDRFPELRVSGTISEDVFLRYSNISGSAVEGVNYTVDTSLKDGITIPAGSYGPDSFIEYVDTSIISVLDTDLSDTGWNMKFNLNSSNITGDATFGDVNGDGVVETTAIYNIKADNAPANLWKIDIDNQDFKSIDLSKYELMLDEQFGDTFYVDDGRNDVWGTPFDKRKDYVLNGPQSAYVDARLRTYTGEKLGLNPIQVEGNNLKIVADRVPAESRAKFDNIMDFTDNNKVNTYYRQGGMEVFSQKIYEVLASHYNVSEIETLRSGVDAAIFSAYSKGGIYLNVPGEIATVLSENFPTSDVATIESEILDVVTWAYGTKTHAPDGALSKIDYYSASLETYKSFGTTYGYFEIRAKMPEGKSHWPAFWGATNALIWPPEIDFFEILGKEDNVFHGAIHLDNMYPMNHPNYDTSSMVPYSVPLENPFAYDINTREVQTPKDKNHASINSNASNYSLNTTVELKDEIDESVDIFDDFYIYATEWGPEETIFYFGKDRDHLVEIYRTVTPEDTTTPMAIILNNQIGGSWAGNPDPSLDFEVFAEDNAFEIDYVKIYADKPSMSLSPSSGVISDTDNNEGILQGSASAEHFYPKDGLDILNLGGGEDVIYIDRYLDYVENNKIINNFGEDDVIVFDAHKEEIKAAMIAAKSTHDDYAGFEDFTHADDVFPRLIQKQNDVWLLLPRDNREGLFGAYSLIFKNTDISVFSPESFQFGSYDASANRGADVNHLQDAENIFSALEPGQESRRVFGPTDDMNQNNILDIFEQSNAGGKSVINSHLHNGVFLERGDSQIHKFTNILETSMSKQDSEYQYPFGIFDLHIISKKSIAGESTESITILLDKEYDSSQWIWRSFNSDTQTYETLDGVTIASSGVNGGRYTSIHFEITNDPEIGDLNYYTIGGPAILSSSSSESSSGSTSETSSGSTTESSSGSTSETSSGSTTESSSGSTTESSSGSTTETVKITTSSGGGGGGGGGSRNRVKRVVEKPASLQNDSVSDSASSEVSGKTSQNRGISAGVTVKQKIIHVSQGVVIRLDSSNTKTLVKQKNSLQTAIQKKFPQSKVVEREGSLYLLIISEKKNQIESIQQTLPEGEKEMSYTSQEEGENQEEENKNEESIEEQTIEKPEDVMISEKEQDRVEQENIDEIPPQEESENKAESRPVSSSRLVKKTIHSSNGVMLFLTSENAAYISKLHSYEGKMQSPALDIEIRKINKGVVLIVKSLDSDVTKLHNKFPKGLEIVQ